MNNVIIRKELSGRVLDIGGGGEGVIGRVYGTQVTAIDISPEELAEAPEGFEKLVMDAGDMNFPDASFDHVTAFYSFLFIAKDQHAQVIAEIARVLRPSGELHIWDCEVASAYPEPFTVELDIDANGVPIHTTYGILEKDCVQTADRLIKACEAAGLRLCGTEQNGTQFCLRFRKGYEIRLAEEGDAAEIAELCTNELGYRTFGEQVKEKLTALLKGGQERIIVAVADGRVVGFIHAAPYETLYFPPLKNLLGLAVAAAYRHRGIGSALLDAVEAWAKETGASGVRLNSGSTRLDAHQFYRKHGYGLEKQQLRLINFFENEGSPEK